MNWARDLIEVLATIGFLLLIIVVSDLLPPAGCKILFRFRTHL